MKQNFVRVGAVAVLLALTGCGMKPGNLDAYQEGSTSCSDIFVINYNQVNDSINFAINSSDLNIAQSLVGQFASKYKDVVCDAGLNSSSQLDPTPTTINVNSQVQTWSDKIAVKRARFQ